MTLEENKNISWVCTDPDKDQYGRKVSEGVYEFKERNWYYPLDASDMEWVEMTIYLKDYNIVEVFNMVGAYYTDFQIERMLNSEKDEDEWIIAECIFEQESGLY